VTGRLPRGVRLNNPGNIERTDPRTPWQGAAPIAEAVAADPRFEVFSSHVWGIRAIARTLVTYQDRHNCRTPYQHMARWAPPVGRDQNGRPYTQKTGAYADVVARAIGVERDDVIDVTDYDTALRMIRAIVRHENGDGKPYGRPSHWYPDADYAEALRRAGIVPKKPQPVAKSESARAATVSAGSAVALGAASVADQVQVAAPAFVAPPVADHVPIAEVQRAAEQVAPHAAPGSWLSVVLVLVIVACSGYVIFRAWKRRKTGSG